MIRSLFIRLKEDKRTILYKKNTIILFTCQIINILVNYLLVSIVLNYLGIIEYGVWITLTTIIAWLGFFDIGLGHGLRNKYAIEIAKKNYINAKKYVSTTFFSLIFISIIIFIITTVIIYYFNCSLIIGAPLHMEGSIKNVLFILLLTFCIRFIINIVLILQTAEQKPATNAIAIAIGNLLSLLFTFVLVNINESSLLLLSISLSISQITPIALVFLYLFKTKYKHISPSINYFQPNYLKDIFTIGFKFFFIQLTGLIIFQSNNIIIARTCNLQQVTEYNIGYKYLWIIVVLFNVFLTPFWSASTEAYQKKDKDWINKSILHLNKIWVLMLVLGIILIIISPFIYNIWLNNKVKPNLFMLITIYSYFIFYMKHSIYRNFMNGVGKIQLQFYITIIQSIIHIPLALFCGKLFGSIGVIFIMLLWAFINSIWEPIQFKKIIQGNSKGIWIR